jgi:hypothetical protein
MPSGRGQIAARGRRLADLWRDRLLAVSLAVNLFAAVVISVVSIGVVTNTGRIASQEANDRDALRAASFRICARSDETRADLHWAATARGEDALRTARERRLPILDCSPNLDGDRAVAVPTVTQRAYVDLYVKGRAPVICDGVVVANKGRPQSTPLCRGAHLLD